MLIDDNYMFSQANEMISPENTDEHKLKIKATFMEALINFLTVYAESELSSDIEINLPLVSLYINSQEFENVLCSYVKNIDDIYKILEMETLIGLPIWRFLKINDFLKNSLEKNYENTLKENNKYIRENYPCKRCIFFREMDTPFGYLSECKFDEWKRANSVEWSEIKNCKNLIDLDTDIEKFKSKGYTYRRILSYRDELQRRIDKEDLKSLDKYKVTLEDIKDSEVSLKKLSKEEAEEQIWKDFGYAMKNKRTSSDRKKEYRKAIILSSFVEFVDLYIKTEIGSGYKVNLYEVLKYIEHMDFDFESKEEVLKIIEDKLVNDKLKINNFIERDIEN